MGEAIEDVHQLDPQVFWEHARSFEFWFGAVQGYLEGSSFGRHPEVPEKVREAAERDRLVTVLCNYCIGETIALEGAGALIRAAPSRAAKVFLSTQTVDEQSESQDAERIGAVSAAENLPDAQKGAGDANSNSNRSGRTEEIINYEISRTVRTHIREGGTMRRLSVAVLVDGNYLPGAEPDSPATYQPRSDEELAKLTELIKGAVGFNEERGDSVDPALIDGGQ